MRTASRCASRFMLIRRKTATSAVCVSHAGMDVAARIDGTASTVASLPYLSSSQYDRARAAVQSDAAEGRCARGPDPRVCEVVVAGREASCSSFTYGHVASVSPAFDVCCFGLGLISDAETNSLLGNLALAHNAFDREGEAASSFRWISIGWLSYF